MKDLLTHRYYVRYERFPMRDAIDWCRSLGSNLLTLETQDEQTAVLNNFQLYVHEFVAVCM